MQSPTVHCNEKYLEVYAFLDERSATKMVAVKIEEQLGAFGPYRPLYLGRTGDITKIMMKTKRIMIGIPEFNMKSLFTLKVQTVNQLKFPWIIEHFA